jgi:hypothetical protein
MELDITPAPNPQNISEILHKQIYIQYFVSMSRNKQHNFYNRNLLYHKHKHVLGISDTTYRVLVGNPERKRQIGRSRSRWDDNLKIYPTEIGF